jgi:hypothetical protein
MELTIIIIRALNTSGRVRWGSISSLNSLRMKKGRSCNLWIMGMSKTKLDEKLPRDYMARC